MDATRADSSPASPRFSSSSMTEEAAAAQPTSPTTPKPHSRRQISSLTLPHESMDSISRTTTVAGTPAAATDMSAHPFSAFYSHPACVVSSELPLRPSLSRELTTMPRESKDLESGLAYPMPTMPTLGADLSRQCSAPSYNPSTAKTSMSLASPSRLMLSKTCTKDMSYVSVWPTCEEVQQRRKAMKRAKGCLLYRNLSRKQTILAKVCLAFVVLSIVTVIAVVISYKTGGLVWKSANNYGAIGQR